MFDINYLTNAFGGFIWVVCFFVIALSVIVAVHEYGHYIVGKWCGIKAEVFSVGFGTVLISRVDKHGTRWQIAALPAAAAGSVFFFGGTANANGIQFIENISSTGNATDFEVPKHESGPHVIMVVGVNGVGKTTTIGKLANQFKNQGLHVVLGAADTFRAAAIDQLQVWADRTDVPLIKQDMGSDPASVAFDTLQSGVQQKADVIIIDTAGRLHNKVNLMNELTKIKRVMQKVVPDAPHDVLLVLDGSTGQNAFEQAKQFTAATEVTSLAVTKLDGTAKGGVVIGISDQFQIPVKYIGVGEGIDDLQVFNKLEFVDSFFN